MAIHEFIQAKFVPFANYARLYQVPFSSNYTWPCPVKNIPKRTTWLSWRVNLGQGKNWMTPVTSNFVQNMHKDKKA